MPVKRIAFANQKGGVGKSTICTQLAFYLAEHDKKKVLVVDMDAQGNSTSTLTHGEEPTGTLANELFREEAFELHPMTTEYGIDLIGSRKNDREGYDVEALPLDLVGLARQHLESIWDNYDYLLIDCPPSLGRKLLAALLAVKYVVSPIKLSGYAVDGLAGLFETLYDIKQSFNDELEILGAIVNEYDKSAAHNVSLANVREAIPDLVFDNLLQHRSPIDTATMLGQPIWKTRNGKAAAQEFAAVFEELKAKIAAYEH